MQENHKNASVIMTGVCLLLLVLLNILVFVMCIYKIDSIVSRILSLAGYSILFIVFGKAFNFFKVSYCTKYDLIYNGILTISCCLIYLFMLLFYFGELNILSLLVLFLSQIVVLIIWAYFVKAVYIKTHKRNNIVFIFGKPSLTTINKITEKIKESVIVKSMNETEGYENIIKESSCMDGFALYEVTDDLKSKIIEYGYTHNKIVFLIPSVNDILRDSPVNVGGIDSPMFMYSPSPFTFDQLFFKRLLDLVIIIPVTIVALPFMVITAIVIKLYDRGPIFYSQNRLTREGKVFKIYKFRSMKVDAESDGKARLATQNDNRVTGIGKIIRAIRFDELPQLWNILKGDMSIVGPRPERPEISKEYEKELPEFGYRTHVKAGLTGYAQVFGKYNTTPSDKLKYDLIYIKNYSLKLDILLILLTVKILFLKESTEGVDEGKDLAL